MYSVQIDAGDRVQRKQTGKYPHGQKFSHIQNLTEKMAKPRFGQSFLPGSVWDGYMVPLSALHGQKGVRMDGCISGEKNLEKT